MSDSLKAVKVFRYLLSQCRRLADLRFLVLQGSAAGALKYWVDKRLNCPPSVSMLV